MGRPVGTTKTRKIDSMLPKPKGMPWFTVQYPDGCKHAETCEKCPLPDCKCQSSVAGKNLRREE